MNGLQRTDLTTSRKVEFAAKALARQQQHGAKAELSRQYEVSRPTVYSAGATAEAVLTEYFEERCEKRSALRVQVDEAQLRRAVIALRASAPNALRPIEDLIAIIYPGVEPSYGKVQRLCAEAERKAAELNEQACLAGIKAAALDEMFSQGDPVLAGVDLDSGYLFALSLRHTRSADDWAEVLDQGRARDLALSVVVKDAGAGLAGGVTKSFPRAEQRDDCFHALFEMNKVRRRLEQRAYAAIDKEQRAERELGKIRLCESERRKSQHAVIGAARRQCNLAIARYDDFESAMRQAHEAMEFVDLQTGAIRTAEQVRAQINAAATTIQALNDPKCRKVGRYLSNRAPGLALAMTELEGQLRALAERYGEHALSLACVIERLVKDLRNRRRPWQRSEQTRHLFGAFALLNQRLGTEAEPLLDAVAGCLEHHHRASSAIEGFNAALRPFLYVHKGVTQGFLELFRFRFNHRIRRWGRHQGTSAHQALTGQAPQDWLSLLGYPPSATLH